MDLFDILRRLDKLPEDILERSYSIEVISRRALLQHNTFLEDKYKGCKIIDEDSVLDVFQDYKINGWDVRIEVAE